MNLGLVNEVTKSQLKTDIPAFRSGSTVRVHVKIKEGDKSRIQVFEGVVIERAGEESLKHSQFVRFLTKLVLNVNSLYTHQSLTTLK